MTQGMLSGTMISRPPARTSETHSDQRRIRKSRLGRQGRFSLVVLFRSPMADVVRDLGCSSRQLCGSTGEAKMEGSAADGS